MASLLGFEVDLVFWGFLLLSLFAVILFLDNLLSYRKYRLLKQQFDELNKKYSEEEAGIRSEVAGLREMAGGAGVKEALQALDARQVQLAALEARVEKELAGGAHDASLSRKVTLVKKLEREFDVQRKRLSELRQDHAELKAQFHKHEVTPVHVEASNVDDLKLEVSRAFDELLKAEGELHSLSRKVVKAQKKANFARLLAEEEPKKRVAKKTFRKTVKSLRRAIAQASIRRVKVKAPVRVPAPARV